MIDLEQREPSAITLSELKDVVTSRFSLENHEFHLSLNKIDALVTDDEQTLESAGIVSGDLLHIIGQNLPTSSPVSNFNQRPQPQGSLSFNGSGGPSPTAHPSDVSMVSAASNSSDTDKKLKMADCDVGHSGQEPSRTSSESDVQINRFLLEPLVVRESTATQVPILLEQLFHSAACNCSADAVWVVVHTLMLESGFLPQTNPEVTQLPTGWKQSGFYKCAYHLPFPGKEAGECSVVGVPVASSLVVHGLASSEGSFKTEHVQLKTTDFVTSLSDNVPSVFVGLDRLSRQVKDTVCLPLQNELATAAGFPGGQGFTSLPYEIKIRVLSCLDPVTLCRVIQTESELGALAKEKVVWRRIYIRDFGKPESSDLRRDWYELYKEEFVRRREDENRRQQFRLDQVESFFHLPGAFRTFPDPGIRFPPHMVGGDYDLNPEFAAGGIPNPMGSGPGRRPGPVLPNVRIPDPLGGDPFGLGGGVGRRPGRGNMTGSPFSMGGRGGLFRSPFM